MLVLRGHNKSVRSLAFSPVGRLLASSGADKAVHLWDLTTGQLQTILKGPRTYAHTVAFSPDGHALACAGGDLLLWHLATGRSVRSRPEDVQTVGDVDWAADGQTLATASRLLGGANTVMAGSVQLWDAGGSLAELARPAAPPGRGARLPLVPQAERTAAVEKHLGASGARRSFHVWSVAFSPHGSGLALGTDNGGIFLWDATTGDLLGRLPMSAAVHDMDFTADGRLLAATEGFRVRVWESATQQPVCALHGHEKRVTCLAFARGGSARAPFLLTGSEDETVRVWDAGTGNERSAFRWPVGKVRAVAVAHDGMTAAAAGDSTDVVIWDLEEV
jgi:WD40 repeat protein